ncbi:sperm flagellar protein 2 isoform X2 [Notolabrus celidotus]|uniref:sperm flagellar protein 2 isoform X2 n=1 Tax=Notolabrus celidotus TaxID=1203425 RepID=UPI00148F6FC0|nr:sperm flagellar protein 2 isoform X2 [Notolabrus celidotus]
MSDILCRWLNEELRLSKTIEPKTFANNFSSGYLIGEVLHKYQLQNDFSMFMKKDTSISKLNNFTRLEPTLQLLGISFDINTAQDLMQERQGVATRLLYQLYISLEKKKKAEISGTVMEIMQPAANAGLHKKEHEIYSDRLHQVVKRDAELKLHNISEHYEEKCQQLRERSVMTHLIQQTRPLKGQEERRMTNIEKMRMCRKKHNSIMTYKQAAIVQVPRPPPYTSQLDLKKRHQLQRREQQAQRVQTEIAQFETNRKKVAPYSFVSPSSGQPFPGDPLGGSNRGCEIPGSGTKLVLQSNSKYLQDIRQRGEESALAREQREKRQFRSKVEQLMAHEAQEEAQREEQLVRRLTSQAQQEQRSAAQHLQMRKQKEVIRESRLFREKQYQQRRERDFREALEREAALAQQARLEGAEEIRKELELSSKIAAERTESRYKKHFAICKDTVEQVVDLATKIGEYRLLTGKLIPQKLVREWKELLFSGLPLYEPVKDQQPGFEFSTQLDPVELKKQELLKNQDYDEYTNMVGEWAWPEEAGETKLPLTNNNILGHVVQRLRNIVNPHVVVEPSLPSFPHFALKACVLGKFCSGKTTCLSKIAQAHGIHVLAADTLIEEALDAHKNEEVMEQQGESESEKQHTSSTLLKPDLEAQEECRDSNIKLSTQAMLGAAAEKELKKGSTIPDELLLDIIVEAIRKVPARSGWILDGFPADITHAHLLEKALGGSVDGGNDVVDSRTNLAADPNPPKPPPAPAPALDLALLFDVPDECVVKRAFGQESCVDAATSHSTDNALYQAQTLHRITAFHDSWPKLENMFGGKQNILVRVDADVDEEELYKRVESALQQVMLQRQEDEGEMLESGRALETHSSATSSTVDRSPAIADKALGLSDSCSSLKGEKTERLKSLSRSNSNSPRGHSRRSSISSLTNIDTRRSTKIPPGSPLPGSPTWVYIDEPLPPEIPENLCPHWDEVCNSYVNNIKTVMQQLRSQRTVIDHHLYNIREKYKHYLGRPDLKQELVSQWQKDFNSIADDMREDEDTKAELHLRLDELRERLWDISDKRKEEDEQEKEALGESWLEDHSAVVINNHSVLMQVELDRFQDTLCILKVYYLGMYKQVLPELPSNFVCIPLLDKDLTDESTEPVDTSVCSQTDDGELRWKSKFIPFLPRRPDPSGEMSETKSEGQAEPVKQPHEKLISDYEEALAAIRKLVSAEAHQRETTEQKEKPPEKEKPKAPGSAKKKDNRKQSSKKTKDPPTPPPAPSPAPAEAKNARKSHAEKVRDKIHKEYAAALGHEGNAAKVRIALVKGHGLVMLHSLHSRAEQTFSSMEKWLQDHYLTEMKSIDQLTEVVRHHIETDTKLQKELVLESTDFYLNGDCHMVASPAPPSCPTPLEKPIQSTPTITQLEALYQQLYSVAPSGLISSSEFSSMLEGIISVNMDRNSLPQLWLDKNKTQWMEIVSLLTDDYELIDWRCFLLSAALPWPLPSPAQLLEVLQHFKTADTGNTGYINENQYQQTELWFSKERAQPVPEDPSEPVPNDRLTNLHKFFFQLFADHSISPPQLDYVSMLQYLAADHNPKEGFIRALSVVSGQHLKHSSMGQLVKSMPSIELSSPDLDKENKEEETNPCASSSVLEEQGVSISALLAVVCHKLTKMKEGQPILPGCPSQQEYTEQLVDVFKELGYKAEDCVPFSILSKHPFIQELIETSTQHQLVNIHGVLLAQPDERETHSPTIS